MNLLFYVEPLIEMGKPYWKKEWVNNICLNIVKTLEKSDNDYSFELITSEAIAQKIELKDEKIKIHTCTQQELLKPFGTDYSSASKSWHLKTYTQEQLEYYKELMRLKLNSFIPDVIISFTPVDFLQSLFSDALVLHHEFSIFSRLPYPQSWFLDPVGVSSHSFLNKFQKEIESILLDEEQLKSVEKFKTICQETLKNKSPFEALLKKQREKFEYLVLLPLQFSRYYLFDDIVSFKNQYEYCVYVLDNTPESVGIVVNMHPEYPILEREAIEFLKSKYPNFICLDAFNDIYASGQFILPFVDGVISVSSSIALQAILFDKRVILLGESCFEYIADASCLSELKQTLDLAPKSKNEILYFLLTKYAITSEYIYNPLWLDEFLKKSLEHFRKGGIGSDFYDLIDDEKSIFENLESQIVKNSNYVPQYIGKKVIELFFDFGEGVCGDEYISKSVKNQNVQTFVFDIKHNSSVQSLRIDPLNECCVVDLKSFILVGDDRKIDVTQQIYSNACCIDGSKYFFESNDPQMFFKPKDREIFNGIKKVNVRVEYLHRGEDALHDIFTKQFEILSTKEDKIVLLEEVVSSKEDKIVLLEEAVSSKEAKLNNLEKEYLKLLHSNSMKITAPLRAFSNIFKRYINIKAIKSKIKYYIFNAKVRNKLKNIEIFSKKNIEPNAPWLHSFVFHKLKRYVKQKVMRNLISTKRIEGIDFSELFTKNEAVSKNEPLISVIVPNYNHEPYLKERLESIYNQSYKNFEVILLDDMSSDASVGVLQEYVKKYPDITRLIVNEVNSGGVFHQWKKGVECARGELIWIAESDDFCSLNLLEKLVPFFDNDGVMLAYAKTIFMQNEKEIWSISEYLSDIDSEAWNKEFISCAHTLVNKAWGIKNILPNASSAVFRNPKGLDILDNDVWKKMRICGDWVFYLHMIRGGLVGYTPDAINYYRLHNSNTSVATYAKDIYYQEHEYVAQTLCKLYKIDENLLDRQMKSLKIHWDSYMENRSDDDFLKLYSMDKIKNSMQDRKPNIMMVTYAFAAGGGETLPIKIANLLSKYGYAVTMLSLQQDDENPKVRSMLLKHIPLIKMEDIEKTEAIATGLGIEVIHSHHAWVDLTLVSLLQENKEIAMVISTHGMYEMMDNEEFKENFELIKQRVDKIVYTAEKNLAPFKSVETQDNYLVKIGNALEKSEINPVSRKELNIDEDSFVLCLVSRAIPQKGWEEAIESVKKAREICNREIDLVLIGEGEEYVRLKEIVSESFIHFCGFKDNIRDYYAMSDLGFLPSRFEGESFPLVIIDSLYANKPVLASNIGEINEMLHENGEYAGAVFDLNDMQIPVDEVATMITKFAEDKEFYKQSVKAIEEVILKYDPKKMIEKYDIIYNEVCKKRV